MLEETYTITFYGCELIDRSKIDELLITQEHAYSSWLNGEFGKTKNLVIPKNYQCSKSHKDSVCNNKIFRIYHKKNNISDKYCRIIMYGDGDSHDTTRLAIAVIQTVYGDCEESDKKSAARTQKYKRRWDSYLLQFAKKLNAKIRNPQWHTKTITY